MRGGTGAVNTVLNLATIPVEQSGIYQAACDRICGQQSAGGILDTALGIGIIFIFHSRCDLVQEKRPRYGPAKYCRRRWRTAVGQGIGGNITNVTVKRIFGSVSAQNLLAGGFAGSAGTGSLVNSGGLDLLGTQFIEDQSSLLSLAQGIWSFSSRQIQCGRNRIWI